MAPRPLTPERRGAFLSFLGRSTLVDMAGQANPPGVSSGIYRTIPAGSYPGMEPLRQRITRNANGDVVQVEEMVNGQWQTTSILEYVDDEP
jgi:hypothetical protein